jgi:hypothetical protein
LGLLSPSLSIERLARSTALLVVAVGAGFVALVADAGQVEIPREGLTIVHKRLPITSETIDE